jgi:hypothetical protein
LIALELLGIGSDLDSIHSERERWSKEPIIYRLVCSLNPETGSGGLSAAVLMVNQFPL